jgi:DNA-binding cell septation regulator SpoVG
MRDYCYIVAGTHAEYLDYQYRKFNEDAALVTKPKVYVYVDSVHRLRGMNEVHGFFIGTYEKRADINDIKEMIHIINSKTKATTYIHYNPISAGASQWLKGLSPSMVIIDELSSFEPSSLNV